jgi:LacI family transcriptional regulator
MDPSPKLARMTPIRRRRRSAHTGTPTLRDVASAAGVSTASVSRALTRPELVAEASREAILSVARELGYIPNAAARTLSGRGSKMVGAVFGNLDDPVAGRAIDALMARLEEDGWALMLATARDGVEASVRMRELVARGCDGLAFFDVDVPADPAAPFPVRPVPCACIDQEAPGEAMHTIGFDRGRALALGARYLRELGHRRIGLFGLGHARLVGAVHDALAGTDVTLIDAAAESGIRGSSAVRDMLEMVLAMPDPPTALVCGSDVLAAAILRECALQGVLVPGRLSLVGFGDTDLARHTRPGLTTLRVPAHEAGIAAAEFLLAAMAGEPAPAKERAVKLVARESTALAPA